MKTYSAKKAEITQQWLHVDAEGKVLGRLATQIARILMGKHKTTYTPHMDCGDFVVVTNAEKVKVTGKKMEQHRYWRDSHYLKGLKSETMAEVMEKKPEKVLYMAVKRMLPKTKLGRAMLKKFKVYPGDQHPHKAQMPEKLELTTR